MSLCISAPQKALSPLGKFSVLLNLLACVCVCVGGILIKPVCGLFLRQCPSWFKCDGKAWFLPGAGQSSGSRAQSSEQLLFVPLKAEPLRTSLSDALNHVSWHKKQRTNPHHFVTCREFKTSSLARTAVRWGDIRIFTPSITYEIFPAADTQY